MSISAALNGALSGLQAFGRMSETISANVANAATPGYATRSVDLTSNAVGVGVSIVGVARGGDPGILATRRSAEAQLANVDVQADFQTKLFDAIGSPDDPSSLTARFARFEGSLIEAASDPSAAGRLDSVVFAAKEVVAGFMSAAASISEARTQADRQIAREVDQLNASLRQVADLNKQITVTQARGGDVLSLIDQRQIVIDGINALIPLREIARPNGQVSLLSEGGTILLDGSAPNFAFTAATVVTPYQTVAAGTLSTLSLNGEDLASLDVIKGGRLAALFGVRDDAAPQAQAQLDAVARDLIERLQTPSVDPSLSAGDAGLFTDAGTPFAPMNEVGLANRIAVNAAVDPNAGGEVWRIQSGLEAAAATASGDATLLVEIRNALTSTQSVSSGTFSDDNFEGVLSQISTWVGVQSARTDARMSFVSASYAEAQQADLVAGVDTDAELQSLLFVEQAYAANARVLQTVDEMMEIILGLG